MVPNYDSFIALKPVFNHSDEIDEYLLSTEEIKEIDKQYGSYFDIYDEYSSSKLVNMSHRNLVWINAKWDFTDYQVCKNTLKEDDTFITFIG